MDTLPSVLDANRMADEELGRMIEDALFYRDLKCREQEVKNPPASAPVDAVLLRAELLVSHRGREVSRRKNRV